MIDDGLLNRFPMSAIYGMHNKPGLAVGSFATRVGPMMSSEDLFEITITGRGGHASTPERHIDPIVIAARTVTTAVAIASTPSSTLPVRSTAPSWCSGQFSQ